MTSPDPSPALDRARVQVVTLRPDALRARFAHPPAWTPEVVQEPKFMQRAPAAVPQVMMSESFHHQVSLPAIVGMRK